MRRIGFLIVGTPRSGTTLLQRLASEMPGVRVPPETHFFPLFGRDLLHRRTFPLGARVLEEELRAYLALPTSRGMDLDPMGLVSELGGECSSILELFAAIVCGLAGPAVMYGEKTPNHLLWWRPLARALPHLRMVAIVRDPRAVVNSYARAPFGMGSHVALAESWSWDQRLVRAAQRELGARRCLVMRYEDVVEDPVSARDNLRGFLDVEAIEESSVKPTEADTEPPRPLFMPWETWKESAAGPVVQSRAAAWREELAPREARVISSICRKEMEAFGYDVGARQSWIQRAGVRGLHPADEWRRWHFRLVRRRRMRDIEGLRL
jgi:hypothetical protein